MKYLLALLLMTGTAQAEPLRMAFSAEPYPPFTYKSSSGDWTGFEVELGQKICTAMGSDCELSPTGWSGIIPSLTSGKVDFILGSMSITEDRDKVIDFSAPYYDSAAVYIGRDDMDFADEGDLDGKILAVQASTTHATYARQQLGDSGATVRIYDQHEQMNRDLQAGRVDVILADEIASLSFLERDDAQGFKALAEAPKNPIFGQGIGVGLRDGDAKLQASMNDAIASVIADGTCAQLSQKYFGINICAD
ncbi:transporter substrate-binding domain-containing protein [Paracoccus homiensis]|uniref:transporter substrate-binding domain-containing protein n=1 Tax=Paracoccus homiensis TaxID=364199 RepID=UPI00398CA524